MPRPSSRGGLVLAAALASAVAAADEGPEPVAAAREVSFDEALQRAVERNPTALQAIEELGRAQALVEEARAPSLPQLALNGVLTQLDGPRVLNGSIVLLPGTSFNADVMLTIPVLLPAKWAQWAHATDQVAIAQVSVAEARRQLAIAAGHTWLSLLAQHKVVQLDEEALASDRAHAVYTGTRLRGGFGNRIDDVRANQLVAADRAQLEAAVAQLLKLREALGVLTAADEPLDVRGSVSLGDVPALAPALDEALRRPDVQLATLRRKAADHVVRDDYADYLPTLSLVGYPFFQDPAIPTVPQWGWEVQAVLQWVIYDGGLRYGLAHERARLQREAELSSEATQRQSLSDVRSASAILERSRAALAQALEAARLAAASLDLATLAYRSGAVSNIEVIDAERAHHDAEIQATSAADAATQAQFDLLTAMGRLPGLAPPQDSK